VENILPAPHEPAADATSSKDRNYGDNQVRHPDAIYPSPQGAVMKPLFLNPPSFEDFDGGAGARYQASREVTSFWYPTWLCFPAGMIEGSRVVDAPVQKFTLEDCLTIAKEFDMVVMYTSTPTLMIDIETARRIKEVKPDMVTVLTGPHVTVLPEESLRAGKGAIDIVCLFDQGAVRGTAMGQG
jgi:hypothetical protein